MAKISKKVLAEQRRKLYMGLGVLGVLLLLLVIVRCSTGKKTPQPDDVIISGTGTQAVAPGAAQPAPPAQKPAGISISPIDPTSDSRIELSSGMNLDKASVVWLVNGAPVSTKESHSFSVRDDGAKKGGIVQAVVKIGETEYRSNEAVVRNSPPVLGKVHLRYEGSKAEPDIFVDVEASDPDGDPVTIEYEWMVGDNVVSTSRYLKKDLIKRGTEFRAKITPFDGEARGNPAMLRKSISNISPLIDPTAGFTFDGTELSYQVKASDPDGDILRYGLANAPAGMIINEDTGLVTWTAPPSVINSVVPFTVTANDSKGGSAHLEVKITFTSETVVTKTNKKLPAAAR